MGKLCIQEGSGRVMISNLIEGIPNVSEGRNVELIGELSRAIRDTSGVKLLHVESGYDTHRSVFTYVGPPEAMERATFALVERAAGGIDMRGHRGTHPRIGAVDVIPFVPLDPALTGTCVSLSRRLGERIWNELSIPVYLYGKAAASPGKVRLPDLRKGQYEGLEARMESPDMIPDYGERFNKKAGAVVIGVRDVMLAYNINIDTTDLDTVKRIAGRIRTSGDSERKPGLLPYCQADGWLLPGYGYCQVTMNLHNIRETGLYHAFEAVRAEAEKAGLRIRGSELIGMAPLSALTDAGRFYLDDPGAPDEAALAEAVRILGLSDSQPFEPEEKILDYRIEGFSF